MRKQSLLAIPFFLVIGLMLLANVCWAENVVAPTRGTEESEQTTEIDTTEVDAILEKASNAFGDDFEKIREEVVRRAEELRPALELRIKHEDWKMRMNAIILLGWVNHHKEYQELSSRIQSMKQRVTWEVFVAHLLSTHPPEQSNGFLQSQDRILNWIALR